jgi:predicted CoA-binding protein
MAEIVAVVGASSDRRKFGNKAVRAFKRQGYDVRPVHPSKATIEGLPAYRSIADVPGPIDRVTLYVPPEIGVTLLDAIAEARPRELWVNPGAESPALLARARALGLEPIQACSIIAIGEVPDGGD